MKSSGNGHFRMTYFLPPDRDTFGDDSTTSIGDREFEYQVHPPPEMHVPLDHIEDTRMREWAASSSSGLKGPIPTYSERRQMKSRISAMQRRITELKVEIAKERALKAPMRMLPEDLISRAFSLVDDYIGTQPCPLETIL